MKVSFPCRLGRMSLSGQFVTQIFNLPYRRLSVGKARDINAEIGGLQICDTTDYESALRVSDSLSSSSGVALVITLIMLAVITFMAVTFLVLTRGQKSTVTTQTDQSIARLAADNALERAQAELLAPILATSNQFAFGLLVSTNYINPAGFFPNVSRPTNVNYDFLAGTRTPLNRDQQLQNLTNLLFSPRPPVFITNRLTGSNEFRYYLDLNRNGQFDPSGLQILTNQFGQ